VPLLETLGLGGVDHVTGGAQQRPGEQASAHSDLPVNAPHRQIDALGLECLTPRQDVLVDAVDQRAVEIEEHGGSAGVLITVGHHVSLAPPSGIRRRPR
jgi:hypothetical protein